MRFSTKFLGHQIKYDGNRKATVGLCVGGQTISELIDKVEQNKDGLSSKVMVYIGTNDILKNKSLQDMKSDMDRLLTILVNMGKEIIVLTLPPIPKIGSDITRRERVRNFNTYLRGLDGHKQIRVIHITPAFCDVGQELKCNLEYFEREITLQGKTFVDMVHLNRAGQTVLKKKIDEFFEQENAKQNM